MLLLSLVLLLFLLLLEDHILKNIELIVAWDFLLGMFDNVSFDVLFLLEITVVTDVSIVNDELSAFTFVGNVLCDKISIVSGWVWSGLKVCFVVENMEY